jgi:predicted alpha/beta hydrolase family esterase
MAKVLIIHGWTNHRPVGHWQRSLAAALRDQGHLVSYPQLPNADQPILDEWLEVLAAELEQFDFFFE